MVPSLEPNRRVWSLLALALLALTVPDRADAAAPPAAPPAQKPTAGATALAPPPPPEPHPPEKPVVPERVKDFLYPDTEPNGGPGVLQRPVESRPDRPQPEKPDYYGPSTPFDATDYVPPGYTGPSGIVPLEEAVDGHFVPVEDRWRLGLPDLDRYGKGHPRLDDYPFTVGRWWDPYRQNVFKGDYPMFGQNTFVDITGANFFLYERRQTPIPTGAFESTARPFQAEFFGRPNSETVFDNLAVAVDIIHGDAAFKQPDWRVKFGFVSNLNMLGLQEVGIVNPNVRKGVIRNRSFSSVNETFVEKKIADLSPTYDFMSVRVGAQLFNSDFRGFIFNDLNAAVRLFGNYESNRDQYNLVLFQRFENDTNSGLVGPYDRKQRVLIGNFIRQDFILPGYTVMANIHYNHDEPSFRQNRNSQTVRPDIAGNVTQKNLDICYLGFGGDGHMNRFNVNHFSYVAMGRDSNNGIGNGGQDVMAYMGALELSYDRDYVRFRSSYFFASGDGNPNNHHATGFDTIIDNPNFAGTQFSYWQRQQLGLFGVNLKQGFSLIPDLRSSKTQGQSNFVNPGLQLFNLGFDIDFSPKVRMINNYNLLWFDKTAVLDQFLFQGGINRFIGADLSAGIEYRPLLSDNLVMQFGLATLIPGEGFRDLYNRFNHEVPAMVAGFTQVVVRY